jgi:hypothetical protein
MYLSFKLLKNSQTNNIVLKLIFVFIVSNLNVYVIKTMIYLQRKSTINSMAGQNRHAFFFKITQIDYW